MQATSDDSVLRSKIGELAPTQENAHKITLWYKPMDWLGVITADMKRGPSLSGKRFFPFAVGAYIPAIASLPPQFVRASVSPFMLLVILSTHALLIIQARRKHMTGQGNNWRRSRPPTSPLVKDKGAATCNLMCISVTQQGQPPSFIMDLCITHYGSNTNPALDDTLHLPNARDNVLTYRSQMLTLRRFVNTTLHTITTTLYLVHVRCR